MLKSSGIYRITCITTGKHYIGSATVLRARWASHRHMLNHGKHGNKHLQNSFNKYGKDSFEYAVIELCDVEFLVAREQFWIDALDASNDIVGMNNSPTASTTIGFMHSEATKIRLSEIAKKRDQTRLLAYNASCKGKPSWNKGKPGKKWKHDSERVAKFVKRISGKPSWNKGIPMAEEVKARVSSTMINNRSRKKLTVEQEAEILRLRAGGLGYWAIADATGISMSQCHKIYKASIGVFYKSKSPAPAGLGAYRSFDKRQSPAPAGKE